MLNLNQGGLTMKTQMKTRYIGIVDDFKKPLRPWSSIRVYSDEIPHPDRMLIMERSLYAQCVMSKEASIAWIRVAVNRIEKKINTLKLI